MDWQHPTYEIERRCRELSRSWPCWQESLEGAEKTSLLCQPSDPTPYDWLLQICVLENWPISKFSLIMWHLAPVTLPWFALVFGGLVASHTLLLLNEEQLRVTSLEGFFPLLRGNSSIKQ